MDLRAGVIDAVADHRPAVILALGDDVDLVAAARAVLDLPELAGGGMDRKRPARCDGRSSRSPAWRRRGRRTDCLRAPSRRRDADHLAEMIGETLRVVAVGEMLAQRDEQIAVVGLRDAAAIMIARRQRPLLAEDDLDLVEPAACRRRVWRAPRRCGRRRRCARRSRNRWSCSARRICRRRRRAGRPGRTPTPRATPLSGGESCPSLVTMRMRPGRSVTSIVPSGRNASAHGLTRPLATVRTSSSPADDPNAGASPRVPVAIRNEAASRVATASATVTSPTGVFIMVRSRC